MWSRPLGLLSYIHFTFLEKSNMAARWQAPFWKLVQHRSDVSKIGLTVSIIGQTFERRDTPEPLIGEWRLTGAVCVILISNTIWYCEESAAAVLTACVIAGSLSLWLRTDWPWAMTVLDSIEACESLIWLVCGERLIKILPLLSVRPSDSRPPGSRARLKRPKWQSCVLLTFCLIHAVTTNCRLKIFLNGERRWSLPHQEGKRQTEVRLAWLLGKWTQLKKRS